MRFQIPPRESRPGRGGQGGWDHRRRVLNPAGDAAQENRNTMLTHIQHAMNNNQHMLNSSQHPGNSRNQTPEQDNDPELKDQKNFLTSFESLFRKSSLVIITTLGRDYTEKFHVRDLSRMLNYDVSLVSKNLKKIEQMGLVRREDVGNLVFYQANMDSVLLRHMKICFTLIELNDLVQKIRPVSNISILYGSCAKGEDTLESDIDLFIEAIEKGTVQNIINDVQKRILRTLSPVIVTPEESYHMKMTDKNFYSSIHEGIILSEGENVI
jgi:predicted nucleotidyltransferase/predicted transcriptional regulator